MTTSRVGWTNSSAGESDTSFEAFFRRSYPDTVRALVRSGVDAESAADCAQEAYVRAYARWWRIRRYDDPGAWVRRVATNKAIDLHRKQGRHHKALPALAAEVPLATPAPTEPDGITAYSALLPDQQRRAVELCYGQDLTAEQAASQLGISAGAVRFHLSKARATLRPAADANRRDEEVS